MPGRRYSRKDKIVAVMAADMTSNLAASESTGIPESTIRYWLDKPEFAKLRENARERMAEEAMVVARMAWQKVGELLAADRMDPRDVIILTGMATDKSQLLNGAATSRAEATVSILESLPDHEKAALAAAIDEHLAREVVEA